MGDTSSTGMRGRRMSAAGSRRFTLTIVNPRMPLLGEAAIETREGGIDKHIPESVQEKIEERAKATKEFEKKRRTEVSQHTKENVVNPVGILAVHMKSAKIFNLTSEQLYDRTDVHVYFRIHTGGITKCSCLYENVTSPTTLILDDIKHFSVRANRKRGDPYNFLRLEIIVFDPDNPSFHHVLTAREIHIFSLIKSLYCVETVAMRVVDKLIAEVEVEFCFSYGSHGYGFSNQFENRQKSAAEQLGHSIFCRLKPEADRLDQQNDVLTAISVGHPAFINFTRPADIGNIPHTFGLDSQKHDWQTIEEPVLLISKMRKSMHEHMTEYSKLSQRQDRLDYLKDLVQGGVGGTHQSFREEFEVSDDFHLRTRSKGSHRVTRQEREQQDDGETQDLEVLAKILGAAPGIIQRVRKYAWPNPEQELDDAKVTNEPSKMLGVRDTWKRLSTAVNTFSLPKSRLGAMSKQRDVIHEEEVGRDKEADLKIPRKLVVPGTSAFQTSFHSSNEEAAVEDHAAGLGWQPLTGSLMSHVHRAMQQVLEDEKAVNHILNVSAANKGLQCGRRSPSLPEELHDVEAESQASISSVEELEQQNLQQRLAKMSPARVRRLSQMLDNVLNSKSPVDNLGAIKEVEDNADDVTDQPSGFAKLVSQVGNGLGKLWRHTLMHSKYSQVVHAPRVTVTPATPDESDEEL